MKLAIWTQFEQISKIVIEPHLEGAVRFHKSLEGTERDYISSCHE